MSVTSIQQETDEIHCAGHYLNYHFQISPNSPSFSNLPLSVCFFNSLSKRAFGTCQCLNNMLLTHSVITTDETLHQWSGFKLSLL